VSDGVLSHAIERDDWVVPRRTDLGLESVLLRRSHRAYADRRLRSTVRCPNAQKQVADSASISGEQGVSPAAMRFARGWGPPGAPRPGLRKVLSGGRAEMRSSRAMRRSSRWVHSARTNSKRNASCLKLALAALSATSSKSAAMVLLRERPTVFQVVALRA
jgi:hypothetical protein